MAYQVIWSPIAIADLENIAIFIHHDSPIQADRVVAKFLELTGNYGRHPRAATIVPEVKDEKIQHKNIYKWRVVYEIDDKKQAIRILTIVHGKMSFNSFAHKIRSAT